MYYDPHSNVQLRAERTDRTGRYIPLHGTGPRLRLTMLDIVGIVAFAFIIVAEIIYGGFR